jgi:hypothetical protein
MARGRQRLELGGRGRCAGRFGDLDPAPETSPFRAIKLQRDSNLIIAAQRFSKTHPAACESNLSSLDDPPVNGGPWRRLAGDEDLFFGGRRSGAAAIRARSLR